jgi:hypothetical protein
MLSRPLFISTAHAFQRLRVQKCKWAKRTLALLISDTTPIERQCPPERPLHRWIYKATVANAKRGGTVVIATAFDLPGNKGMKEVRLMDW